ncbi:hypothetical protein [Sporocytophaga myxococcoides]|uniref:hypothetical protein n=1 Tax=Sporocytophaga myxococcoides TaxID=153721 RepID=UPI0004215B1E|nr:hypothetical protein [Sporocytophaga myxococcoides]
MGRDKKKNLPYGRENILSKLLKSGKIKNGIEDDSKILSLMITAFEKNKER